MLYGVYKRIQVIGCNRCPFCLENHLVNGMNVFCLCNAVLGVWPFYAAISIMVNSALPTH